MGWRTVKYSRVGSRWKPSESVLELVAIDCTPGSGRKLGLARPCFAESNHQPGTNLAATT